MCGRHCKTCAILPHEIQDCPKKWCLNELMLHGNCKKCKPDYNGYLIGKLNYGILTCKNCGETEWNALYDEFWAQYKR